MQHKSDVLLLQETCKNEVMNIDSSRPKQTTTSFNKASKFHYVKSNEKW